MDALSLYRALAPLPLGELRYSQRTGSTNDDAARWVETGAPDLALVIADEQTAGRGRLQRRWFTPAGTALAFSLVLRPGPHSPAETILHTIGLGALAVSEALSLEYGLTAQIKWPNDVLLHRRKTAGILAEARWQGEELAAIILGIGLNVAPGAVPPVEQIIYPATCLEDWLAPEKRPVARENLLAAILTQLLRWRPYLGQAALRKAWEEHLAFCGETVLIYNDSGQPPEHAGRLMGLEDDGALRLEQGDGSLLRVHFGEIRLRPAHLD